MAQNNSNLERHYEQFNRDHDRLRGELLVSLATGAAAEELVTSRTPKEFHKPRIGRGRKLAIGMVAAVVVVVIAGLVVVRGGDSVTYANVLTRVALVRSVQFTKTLVRPAAAQQRIRVLVLGRYLERQEHLGPDGAIMAIVVSNLRTGAIVMIDPANRRAQIIARERAILPDGSQEVKNIRPMPYAEIYQSIQATPAAATPRKSARELNGRKVIGFDHEVESGVYQWTNTYWVDQETMLPVQVEKKARNKKAGWLAMEWLWSDFVFDEQLDPALFSTEPPAGYAVEQGEIQGFQMPSQDAGEN